jgi:hypothetical protein
MNLFRRDEASRYAGPLANRQPLQAIIDFLRQEFTVRRVAHRTVLGWNLEHRQTTLHQGLPTPPLPF